MKEIDEHDEHYERMKELTRSIFTRKLNTSSFDDKFLDKQAEKMILLKEIIFSETTPWQEKRKAKEELIKLLTL
ncbi:MAG: hypothetical protein LBQ67_02480 [Treponema sp.]|jgi:hypothetical protein|nr:hypothetical protein [Treponema sp.]